MGTQVGQWGNSFAVRIPGACVKALDLKDGTELDITIVDGALLLRPRRPKYTLEDLLDKVTPENIHAETDWGPAVGRESW